MTVAVLSDPLAHLPGIVREIYERAEETGDNLVKSAYLRLYVEIAKARKELNLTSLGSTQN